MLRHDYLRFRESFPDEINIQHKIASSTEKSSFHLHSHMEIVYAVSDNLILYTENQAQRIPAGAILLLNSMSLHYIGFINDGKACDRYVLYFNPDLVLNLNTPEINLLDGFLRQQNDGLILLPSPDRKESILPVLESMTACFKELSSKPADTSYTQNIDQLYLRLELGKLLLFVNRIIYENHGAPESFTYQLHSQSVTEICQYIDTHFQEPLTIDDIAHEFLISKTQLYNIFKEVLHMSVSDYLSHVRITQAKSLLINTEYSVEIISQKVGYSNISSFSRAFKLTVGLGPLQYRKKQR